ncbi:hypothetical protein PR002_g651 [Phytophthora rubi]|uniref:Uncharacterized protein n=1 Tax=Phytophthora rubi TaxID=129364 RepID=A0A6A3P6G6_9STRA|nr:hypothetical protein PR002_g651 [Phytophthora rubi]
MDAAASSPCVCATVSSTCSWNSTLLSAASAPSTRLLPSFRAPSSSSASTSSSGGRRADVAGHI